MSKNPTLIVLSLIVVILVIWWLSNYQFFNLLNNSVEKTSVSTTPTPSALACPPPPGEYLMRSSCPFSSAVIDSECRVVCPLSEGTSYNVVCQKDADCDCSKYQSRYKTEKFACRCAENRCAIAIDKAEVKNWP